MLRICCLLFALFCAAPVHGATIKLCFKNTGDAALAIAITYRSFWGGWAQRGWLRLESGDVRGCRSLTETGIGSEDFYISVWQYRQDGSGGYAAFDVADHREEWYGEVFGYGEVLLRPRSTLEPSQMRGLKHAVLKRLCVPTGVHKRNIASIADQASCQSGEELALLTVFLGTPIYSSGAFAEDQYNVTIASSLAAPLFGAGANSTPQRTPDEGRPAKPRTGQAGRTLPVLDESACFFSTMVDSDGKLAELLDAANKENETRPDNQKIELELLYIGNAKDVPAAGGVTKTTKGKTLFRAFDPLSAEPKPYYLLFDHDRQKYCLTSEKTFRAYQAG